MGEKRGKGEPFELGEWCEVAGQFRKVFHRDFQDFYDKTLSLLVFRQWKIDIVKFDEWLRLRHKDCGEDESVKDIVERHYGQEGLELMERLV